ncbi:unnamed protein product [Orchesella dallaii]|uniref:Uncharacterized protein n=1 Tax=Orchesella dallaii TaxID=48710 RepID=A0ABP1RPE9_9HEXA
MFLFSKTKALESNREHLTHDEAMTELVTNVRGMVENQQHLHTQMNLLKDGQIKHDQKMKNLKFRLKDMTVKMQNSRAITLPPPNMQVESPVNSRIDSPYESDAEGQPATQKEDLENPMNAHIPEPSAPRAPAENTDALPPPKNAYPNGKQQGNRSSQQPHESSSQHANQGEKTSPPENKQPSAEGNKPKSNAGHIHGNGICVPFLEIDAGYFVFQDILPDAYYRSRSTIFLLYIVRNVSLFAVIAEATRILVAVLLTSIVFGESLQNYLQFLISGSLDFRKFPRQYKCFMVATHVFDREMNIILVFDLSIPFWVIVLLFYLVVKATTGVPMVMYVVIVILWVVFVSGAMIWISLITGVCEISKTAVKTCRLNVRYWYEIHLRGYGHRGKILELEANSLQVYCMKYGGFAVIDRQFFITFLSNLVDQIFTTLMIF